MPSCQSFIPWIVSFFNYTFSHIKAAIQTKDSKWYCSWRNLRTLIPWKWHQQRRLLMGRPPRMGSEAAAEELGYCYADFCRIFMLNWTRKESFVSQSAIYIHSTHPDFLLRSSFICSPLEKWEKGIWLISMVYMFINRPIALVFIAILLFGKRRRHEVMVLHLHQFPSLPQIGFLFFTHSLDRI